MGSRFYNLLLKREINYKLGTGFVVPWNEVSNLREFTTLMSGVFYIEVRIAGVILFFGIYRFKMCIKLIIQRKFNCCIEPMIDFSVKYRTKITIGCFFANLGRGDKLG